MKVFLGGTCAETTWRQQLIKQLEIDYFNPVVDDWDDQAYQNEENEKTNSCDIHLYVITKQISGSFSIAEVIQSSMTQGKTAIFQIMPNGFNEAQLKSLKGVGKMVVKHGGIFILDNSLKETINVLNSYKPKTKKVNSSYEEIWIYR